MMVEYTQQHVVMGGVGDEVNLEVDIFGKYIVHLMAAYVHKIKPSSE